VIKPDADAPGFLLLDGNLRMLALKELGQDSDCARNSISSAQSCTP